MDKKKNHVIVISYDAFSKDNWAYAKQQPHLAKLIANGASTNNVQTVYPSLTYIIHSSYVTGMYPKNHGVYHNNPLQPFTPEYMQHWHWYRENIKAKTIYDILHENNLTTAGILWPVSGKAYGIKYNIPEIRAIGTENQAWKILKTGSPLYSMMMEFKYGKIRKGITQPYLDDFTTKVAVDTILTKAPNLLLMHLIELDDTKHLNGTKGAHIEQAIERMDRRIGELVKAVDDKGLTPYTTFIVIGDHSQLDVRYKINLNVLLKEHGLINEAISMSGAPELNWHAYVQAAGGAAYVHFKTNHKQEKEQAIELIKQFAKNPENGIEAIYYREQLDAFGVDERFEVMLEAKEGYCFDDSIDGELIVDLHALNKVYATHGYAPTKEGYTSNLVIAGPSIKQGYQIERAHVVDLAPTLAKLFNVPFPKSDGRVLSELFND